MRALIGLIMPLLLLFSCIPQKEVIIESDYSFKGTFPKYRTFNFMSNTYESGEINEMLVPAFEKLITQRFESQGYQFDENTPDILINYKFFTRDFDMVSVSQPHINQWVVSAAYNENTEQDIIEGYELRDKGMKRGTVIITLYDPKKMEQVWKGYASGLLKPNEDPDMVFMRMTVYKIIDQYKFLADGYKASIK